jgi:hypothetical protein
VEDPKSYARLVNERECDFTEALAALHELLGSTVTMWILAARTDTRRAAVTVRAAVTGALELGDGDSAAVGVHIGDALLVVCAETLARAWRDEYERLSDGARWTVLSLGFRGGAQVEIARVGPRWTFGLLAPYTEHPDSLG